MNLRSLGYRTDLLFCRFDGAIEDRGDCLVARTPSNPSFHWGNFLIFDRPPADGDLDIWRGRFADEFRSDPEVRHIALGWDAPDGDLGVNAPFLEAGFRLDDSIVLGASAVHRPAKFCEEAEIRTICEDWEWEAVIENKVAGREEIYTEAGYRDFVTRQMERRRLMAKEGLGQWFGAFLDGRLAGDLGLFVFEGLGRFQSVDTHPDFRRRGVCGALVYHAATRGFGEMGAEKLVMVADAHYHAAKIYESVGFAPVERQAGLTWWQS